MTRFNEMYQRPSHSRRNSSGRHSEQVKRGGQRSLAFEVLESRTLLTAGLTTGLVALELDSRLVSQLPTVQPTARTSMLSANGLRIEMINTTSPDAQEPSVDDVLVLRLVADQAAHQALMGVDAQFKVTFDSAIIELQETSDLLVERTNIMAEIDAGVTEQVTYRFFGVALAQSTVANEVLLQLPFRVIADGAANLGASFTSLHDNNHAYHGQAPVDAGAGTNGLPGAGYTPSVSGPFVGPKWSYRDGRGARDLDVDGTIPIPRPLAPPATTVPESMRHKPLERSRATLAPDESLSSMLAEPDSEPRASRLSASSSTWYLSSDSVWNRHRPLLVGGGEFEAGSRRATVKAASGLTSRLFADGATVKVSRLAPSSEEGSHSNQHDSQSSGSLGMVSVIATANISQLLDDAAVTNRVRVLRPEECDAVLPEWKASNNAPKPRAAPPKAK